MSYSNNWLESISEAYKSKAKKNEKAYVKEDTETLLAIIEMLCEELDIDVNVLMEQMTIKDWKNLGHAHEWDKPAPAAAPHGSLAANARDILVKAARARGTRSQRLAAAARADAIPAGKKTAIQIETEAPIQDVSEPSAEARAAGAPGAVVDPKQFDRSQRSIEKITDKVSEVEQARQQAANKQELIKRLQPFALGGNKPKGKKKK